MSLNKPVPPQLKPGTAPTFPISVVFSHTLAGRSFRLALFALLMFNALLSLGVGLLVLQTPYIYQKDFFQEYLLTRAAQTAGENPYAPLPTLAEKFVGPLSVPIFPHPTPHPPPVAVFFYPFGWLDYVLAARLWFGLELLAIVLIAGLIVQWLHPAPPLGLVLGVAIALLGLNPVQQDLMAGQLDVVLLLLLVGVWRLLHQEKLWASGVLLGVALALKLFVWPLGVFLVLQKKWPTVIVAGGVFGLANLAAASLMGVETVWNYYTHIGPSVFQNYRAFAFNFSLATIGWRLFEGTGSAVFGAFTALPLYASTPLAYWSTWLITLAAFGGGLWLALRTHNFDLGYGGVMMVAILLSPVAWVHYFVLLVLPGGIAFYYLRQLNYPRAATAMLLGGVLWWYSPTNLILEKLVLLFATNVHLSQPQVPLGVGLLTYTSDVFVVGLFVVLYWTGRQLTSVSAVEQLHRDPTTS